MAQPKLADIKAGDMIVIRKMGNQNRRAIKVTNVTDEGDFYIVGGHPATLRGVVKTSKTTGACIWPAELLEIRREAEPQPTAAEPEVEWSGRTFGGLDAELDGPPPSGDEFQALQAEVAQNDAWIIRHDIGWRPELVQAAIDRDHAEALAVETTGFAEVPWDVASAGDPDYDALPLVEERTEPGSCSAEWRGFADVGETWACTRSPGHLGTHRAGDSVRVVAEWRDGDDELCPAVDEQAEQARREAAEQALAMARAAMADALPDPTERAIQRGLGPTV